MEKKIKVPTVYIHNCLYHPSPPLCSQSVSGLVHHYLCTPALDLTVWGSRDRWPETRSSFPAQELNLGSLDENQES